MEQQIEMQFSPEDWIVHRRFGIGQIKHVETKAISGDEALYYRVEGMDTTTYWIPVDEVQADLIRPLSTAAELQQALEVLQKPAKTMDANYITRKSRIQKVRAHNTPVAMARLIRDLRGKRRSKSNLNGTEREALRTFTQGFANEWAIVRGINFDKALLRLDEMLKNRREKKEALAS